MLEKLPLGGSVIAIILVFAATLLIGNTVRLSAYNRRRETGIMRLVGASNLYIQLPFVMEGVIAGLIGGVVAAILLIVSKVSSSTPCRSPSTTTVSSRGRRSHR